MDGTDIPKPATPDAGLDVSKYKAKVNWKFVLPFLVLVVAVVVGYWWRHRLQTDHMREEIVAAHSRLAPVSDQYTRLRQELEAQLRKLAKEAPKERVHPRFDVAALHHGKGLYVRVPADALRDDSQLWATIESQHPDKIASCLGVGPSLANDLHTKGEFLLPTWLDRIAGTYNRMRLRATSLELESRIEKDLDAVREMLNPDWVMVVIQHGENRRDAAVDLRIWDRQQQEVLVQARIHADGILIPVRNDVDGRKAWSKKEIVIGKGAANDCSIATQVHNIAMAANR